VTDISEEGSVSILCFPSTLKMETLCSSERLLPVPTYQMPRLPVPQECTILNFGISARFVITLYYCLLIRSFCTLFFPSILKMETACSSETLLPVPTYRMTRLPVPQECTILHACLKFEFSARFAITMSYGHPETTK